MVELVRLHAREDRGAFLVALWQAAQMIAQVRFNLSLRLAHEAETARVAGGAELPAAIRFVMKIGGETLRRIALIV